MSCIKRDPKMKKLRILINFNEKNFIKLYKLSWVRGSAFPLCTTREHHHPDFILLNPHTCQSPHSQLLSIIMDYLYTSLPPLCLVVLCMFVSVTVFSHAGDTCTVCCFPCPSRLPVLFFCLVGLFVYENIRLPALGHRPLFFLGAPHPYRHINIAKHHKFPSKFSIMSTKYYWT